MSPSLFSFDDLVGVCLAALVLGALATVALLWLVRWEAHADRAQSAWQPTGPEAALTSAGVSPDKS
ncbi:hypothetical protein QEZ54_06820 [Catellatospora sp. KI3]|uniref:hypothetical protein n=1 Tax=Catellatospora sp. KI3 TaxID=3041620 RepID=UPI00248219ED|nr:hypothetical protein [Catellatospora sp. KI3]MDI1460671.1 hypothetical protein [Catellatospora sp. KI3]